MGLNANIIIVRVLWLLGMEIITFVCSDKHNEVQKGNTTTPNNIENDET